MCGRDIVIVNLLTTILYILHNEPIHFLYNEYGSIYYIVNLYIIQQIYIYILHNESKYYTTIYIYIYMLHRNIYLYTTQRYIFTR